MNSLNAKYLGIKSKYKVLLGTAGLLIFIFILIFQVTAAFAEILPPKTIVIATGEWPPFTSSLMENKGYLSEVVQAAFNEVGINVQFAFYPWKRGEQMVRKGLIWAVFPFGKTQQREEDFNFAEDLYTTITKFFYFRPHSSEEIKKIETLTSLKTYKLGGILGYFYQESFSDLDLKVDYVMSEINNIHKLKKGRIDIAVMNEVVGWSTISNLYPAEIDQFAVIPGLKIEGGNYLMASKKYPSSDKILEKFHEGLSLIKKNGIYQSIINKLASKIPTDNPIQ